MLIAHSNTHVVHMFWSLRDGFSLHIFFLPSSVLVPISGIALEDFVCFVMVWTCISHCQIKFITDPSLNNFQGSDDLEEYETRKSSTSVFSGH